MLYSTIKSIPLRINHFKIFLGTCQNILLKFMVQFSCLVSLIILQPWHNVSTTHLAFTPSQCPRANLWTPLIITCSFSWQLEDLHAKKNTISYQKKSLFARISVSFFINSGAICRLDTPSTWILHKPTKNHSPINFSTTSNSNKFEKYQLLTYLLHILFTMDYLDWLPLLHVNSTVYVYVNSTLYVNSARHQNFNQWLWYHC